jgi:hypothetical protein
MIEKAEVIRRLIERTQQDFVSYYAATPRKERAEHLMSYALTLDVTLIGLERELDQMLPDTEDDGSVEASCALNTGCMMLSLIEVMKGDTLRGYDEAVSLFFDSMDFKIQQSLAESGIERPTEPQIASHELMLQERQWFAKLLG